MKPDRRGAPPPDLDCDRLLDALSVAAEFDLLGLANRVGNELS